METENLDLLKRLISREESLSDISTEDMFALAQPYLHNCTFLYRLYAHTFREDIPSELSDPEAGIDVSYTDETYNISWRKGEKCLTFDQTRLRTWLKLTIDALDHILPLGSVVDLKKEYFKAHLPVDQVDKMRVVITHRFLTGGSEGFYFPYAGVLYPFGAVDEHKYINFTANLIENVVHEGFSDEQDDACVLLMKHEILENMKLCSFGFAPKAELESYQKAMENFMKQSGGTGDERD